MTRVRISIMSSSVIAFLVAASVLHPTDAFATNHVPMRTWNALQKCESPSWHYSSGPGTSTGGLQITDSTWHAFHGKTRHAYQAGKTEQIRVATRIKHRQGWKAWPACSAKLHLR